MKESIISISKPIPKVPHEPIEDDPQPDVTQTEEISLSEELQQPEPELEPIDIVRPNSMRFGSTNSSGWKVSDILREIRLDNFDMGSVD